MKLLVVSVFDEYVTHNRLVLVDTWPLTTES